MHAISINEKKMLEKKKKNTERKGHVIGKNKRSEQQQ